MRKLLVIFLIIILSTNLVQASDVNQDFLVQLPQKSFFSDVAGTVYEKEINTLNSIGVLEGYADNTFLPERKITRAELVLVIVNLLGIDVTAYDGFMQGNFSDIPQGHWAYKTIQVALQLGIVSGYEDGTFGADNFVTYEQSVKMLVLALGYRVQAEAYGGYPVGYFMVASDKGITKNMSLEGGAYIKRGEIARLIYKSLTVPIFYQVGFGEKATYSEDKENTLLQKHLQLEKKTGIVTANEDTALIGDSTLKKGTVIIDDITYEVGATDVSDYLGYQITFFTTVDKDKQYQTILAIHVDSDRNTILTINDDKLDRVEPIAQNKFQFYYGEDGETPKKAILSSTADIIYNGRSCLDFDIQDLQPLNGQLTLIDNNKDNEYDEIFIKSYETYVVDSVNYITYKIFDKNDKESLILDDNNSNLKCKIIKNGAPIAVNDIKEWDVLSVAKSKVLNGNGLITVLVSDSVVNGVATELEEDKAVIGNKEYKLVYGLADKIIVGETVAFCLNHEGRISALNYDVNPTFNYGFLVGVAKENSLGGTPEAKIFTKDAQMLVYKFSDKFTLDGKRVDAKDIFNTNNALYNSSAILQLIRYQISTNGKISEIDTATVGEDEGEHTLHSDGKQNLQYVEGVFAYKILLEEGCSVMTVPTDENGKVSTDLTDDFSFSKKIPFSDWTNYDIEAFNLTDAQSTKLLVFYNKDSVTSTKSEPLLIVDKVLSVLYKDGQNTRRISGLQGGKKVELLCDPKIYENAIVAGLKHGDVIQCNYNMRDEVKGIWVCYSIDDNTAFYEFKSYITYGKVVAVKGDVVTVSTTLLSDGQIDRTTAKPYSLRNVSKMHVNPNNSGNVQISSSATVAKGDHILLRAKQDSWQIIQEAVVIAKLGGR